MVDRDPMEGAVELAIAAPVTVGPVVIRFRRGIATSSLAL
jgi:hypothetical protein